MPRLYFQELWRHAGAELRSHRAAADVQHALGRGAGQRLAPLALGGGAHDQQLRRELAHHLLERARDAAVLHDADRRLHVAPAQVFRGPYTGCALITKIS